MSTTFRSIREYFCRSDKVFVVPNYQRGYKWAVKYKGKDNEEMPSAVEILLNDLISAYDNYKDSSQTYFIQGITVSEEQEKIILIDGQQRTTTLYLLFWCLDKSHISGINLEYDIREESKNYIKGLRSSSFDFEDGSDDPQDIYYFKEAIRQIRCILKKEEERREEYDSFKQEFYRFILDQVNILYIRIALDKATKTFTMMNGSKATMLCEELTKAEMLRKISLPEVKEKEVSRLIDEDLSVLQEILAKDWEINALRNRYAREWDRWLYWWNKEDVVKFFDTRNMPLGLLLKYYYYVDNQINRDRKDFNFNNFKELLLTKKDTKVHFKKLRDLQKSFEDIYNDAQIYNYLGLSLIGVGEDKFKTICYFLENKHSKAKLAEFAKWRMVNATFRQITQHSKLQENEEKREDKALYVFNSLGRKIVYNSDGDHYARKYLLYLNVLEDNKLNNGRGRKFDFSIYGNQSLEHIHPKSKAFYAMKDGFYNGNDEKIGEKPPSGIEWLNRDECPENISEHSIGNLVLIDKNENSKFGNSTFNEKKNIYFDINIDFKSRNLLHTISVFAKESWTAKDIKDNQDKVLKKFNREYGLNAIKGYGNE